ncbi:MAG: hypothetical protein KC777_00635 [Cyanobacteria bacterium HKST-UBA02]|nr:hypothetical protein [Cyanobacteria bacterium HKST-UBA02]
MDEDIYLDRYKKEYQDKLALELQHRFPTLFPEGFSGGFLCPPGWIELVERTCVSLEKYLETRPDRESDIWYVKEKYGGLRIGALVKDEEFQSILQQAERASYKICEQCGEPGVLRYGSWWRTLCEQHAEGRLPQVEHFEGDEELHSWAKNWKGF